MSIVVFAVTPGTHLLEVAGPAQVFSTAADLGAPYELRYIGDTAETPTAQGLPLRTETEWPELGDADLVLVPGWRVAGRDYAGHVDEALLERLRAHHRRGGTVAGVCAGAWALARAGLLNGLRCTTHHAVQEELARRFPETTVVPDVLYVDDGGIITSAGIASGIDLALHLVAVRHGPSLAARVAREMVIYARRNGDESQHSAMLRHRSHLSDMVHRVQDRIDASFTEPLRLERLALEARVSPRTLTRGFADATGMTPLRYQQRLRLERAEHLIGQGVGVESAARAVGFRDARMLRRLRAR